MLSWLRKQLGLDMARENLSLCAAQVKVMAKSLPMIAVGSAVLGWLTVTATWDERRWLLLLGWSGTLTTVHLLQIAYWVRYRKDVQTAGACQRWLVWLLVTFGFAGALWGSAGLFIAFSGRPTLAAFMTTGVAAMTMMGSPSFLRPQQLFVGFSLLPLLAVLLLQRDAEAFLLSGMLGVLLLALLKGGRNLNRELLLELALRQSQENYRVFAEKLPLGVTVLQDGLVRYVNHAIVDLLGYAPEELLGKPFAHLIHETDRPWATDLHRRRMQGEDVPRLFVVRMVHKDGTVRQWEMHTSTTEWEGKRASLAIFADITARSAMEAALHDSLQQLEEKELAKTRFLAAASHDLRQPVAAAMLFLDALKATTLDAKQGELVARLDQSLQVFSELLDRLLNISKLDAGLIQPKLAAHELAQFLSWVEQNFAGPARERGLNFRIRAPKRQPLWLYTDAGLLQSVLMNLVSNAIKYTTRGGVMVSARLRAGRLLIQVWDTGRGIAPEHIDRIFDEFYQVNNPGRNRAAGLGLGLSISRRAMLLLGGKIACRSVPGRGSVFSFTVPLAAQSGEQAALEVPASQQQATLAGKRIVVLEDDQLVADALVSLFRGQGAEVLDFRLPEDALRQSTILNADYYVVDYALDSSLTGVDFLYEVQRRVERPIQAVIMTGETSSRFMQRVVGLSWPVLHKPVNFARLIEVLTAPRMAL